MTKTQIDKKLKAIGRTIKKERQQQLGNREQSCKQLDMSAHTLKAVEQGKGYRIDNLLKVADKVGYEVIVRKKQKP